MSKQDTLKLAKQGNPDAIAALMNRQLQPKGISVRTSLKGDCLRIVLESEQVPDEQVMTAFIQKGFSALNSPAIARVKIFGQQTGDDIPVWSRDLELINRIEADIPVHRAQVVEDAIQCPKCGSTQIMASKKGFSTGKAAIGTVLFGAVGLAGGMIGSNQLMLSCMRCGHQWEPGKPPAPSENPPKHHITSAKVKRMSAGERISMGFLSFFGLGILGIVLFAIPMLGWILSLFCLCSAILIPYYCITGNNEFISKLVGNCPHCGKEVEVSSIKAKESRCIHCHQKFFIRERKFHTILS